MKYSGDVFKTVDSTQSSWFITGWLFSLPKNQSPTKDALKNVAIFQKNIKQ